ncbi:hypothetical protein TNCV_4372931, partial [Trichonephila clavipes]
HWCAKIKDEVEKLAERRGRADETDQSGDKGGNHWEVGGESAVVTSVAAELGIAHSFVSRLWRQISNYRSSYPGFSRGRPQRTKSLQMARCYIVLQARRNTRGRQRREKSLDTRHRCDWTSRYQRSHRWPEDRTVVGVCFARRPVRCVPLTPSPSRRRRSLWCREHRN